MVKTLTKSEEQIMQVFWDLKQGFIRDIIPALPDPRPHYNSVATMVKILEDKGFLRHETTGNMNSYLPVISREEDQKFALKDVVSQYFDNSYPRMLAFFAKEQKLSEKELNEIINIIKKEKK